MKSKNSALWKQFVPSPMEDDSLVQNKGLVDPIGDFKHAKNKQIIHRYTNRALYFMSHSCPVHCRYCFRKNELGKTQELFKVDFKASREYLLNHPEINEIILSGGDPLVLSDQKLDLHLNFLCEFENIKTIRFHSRTPAVNPQRISKELINNVLKKYQSRFSFLFMAHINHIDEIDQDFIDAIKKLQNISIKVFSQTVLLKGVNDSVKDLGTLFTKLFQLDITPYYLHHPDLVKGAMHFHLSIQEGQALYKQLKKQYSSYLIPEYVIDIPGGEGKIPVFGLQSHQLPSLLNETFHTYPPLS